MYYNNAQRQYLTMLRKQAAWARSVDDINDVLLEGHSNARPGYLSEYAPGVLKNTLLGTAGGASLGALASLFTDEEGDLLSNIGTGAAYGTGVGGIQGLAVAGIKEYLGRKTLRRLAEALHSRHKVVRLSPNRKPVRRKVSLVDTINKSTNKSASLHYDMLAENLYNR